ncbi:type II secretion system protein [Clostridium kluyveri]|nr:type II secretion system protein [Clostridium kluyveri]UZQ50780.1 prepilin-type N-terminal cleavage/methylation domain-containing protein [Clostridium kluyveri]
MCRKRGFTLIEIMIVIAVIGILSMVLVPKVGAIKLQSKNKSVSTNALLVRTYLENRAGKDGISYHKSIGENKTSAEAFASLVNNVASEMSSKFYGSNALTNPFNGSSSIVYSQGNVTNRSHVVSSIIIYYCTDTLPSSNDEISGSTILPKGTDFVGNVIAVIYSTGYVLYGLDDSGEIINPPYIIKFPSASTSSSGGGGSSEGGGDDSGNTIGDFFGANCLNVFGDSSDEINLGNGSTNMNITGSAYLQGKKVTFQQNTTVNGDLNILGVGSGSSVVTGNGGNNTIKVTGQTNFQAYNMTFKSNLQTYSNVSILGTNSVTFDNASIDAEFNNGNVQIQSNKDINFYSGVNAANSKFYAVAGGNNYFNNTSGNLTLDNESSAYIQSGENTQFYYKVDSTAPVTMIAGNNLDFGNNGQSVNINGKTYLKAENIISILRSVTLGYTYIDADTFNYGYAHIRTSSLSTCVNNFSHGNGATLTPDYTAVSERNPTVPEAVAPSTSISEITTTRQVKTLKNTNYTSGYDTTTYPGIAFSIVKGSDTNALKQALQASNVDSNIYKFLIIDGDCTLDWNIGSNNFSNFIIYCTGTINLNYIDLSFSNSTIITKNANIKPSSAFTITQPSSTQYTASIKNEINDICDQYLN